MKGIKESVLTGCPKVISYECSQKIIEQMKKNMCKIKVGEQQGTGFFCKIPFPDKNNLLPVLITNNHLINEPLLYKKDENISINIKEETEIEKINLNDRMKYTNEEYDITIIEIKDQDNIKNYLELDDNIINDILSNKNSNKEYIDETIYIIQYPEGKLSVSYGVLDNIFQDKKYNFNHKCSTKGGSSGSPILNLNNKVIGLHKEGYVTNFNGGTFLNYPIKDFIQKNFNNNIKVNNDMNEKLLKEFNKKYNVIIKDDKIEILNLRWKEIGNEGLRDLCKIEFKELKEINLHKNKISDIEVLKNAKFVKLEILNLGQNSISDISILEQVNFKELKELYLYANNIANIEVFEKAKFDKLEVLYLYDNKIDKIKNNSIISKLKSKIKDLNI